MTSCSVTFRVRIVSDEYTLRRDGLKLLDLFCGAGGAGEGYRRAGFEVTGVDNRPMPNNPHTFIHADALEYLAEHGHEYDVIHASPPCQAHTAMRVLHNARRHADMIPATRALLESIGKPYVIENVPGAPFQNGVVLCGTMFGLGTERAELRRHRLFESNMMLLAPTCQHGRRSETIGVYGGHVRHRRRVADGHNGWKYERGLPDFSAEDGRRAMGIGWMTLAELSQAIPPAYTEYIGGQLMTVLSRESFSFSAPKGQ